MHGSKVLCGQRYYDEDLIKQKPLKEIRVDRNFLPGVNLQHLLE